MKIFKAITIFSVALLFMSTSSCQEDKYPEFGDGLYAEFVTNKGTMVAKLFYDKTPVTVANFVALAEGVHPMIDEKYKGIRFYDSLVFHRVMNNFMIQSGCPDGNGRGNPGFKFEDEFHDSLKHDKPGILSMANPGPDSNGSQFFITEAPTPWLDNLHAVFGELVSGLDVQDSISNVRVAQGNNRPVDPIIIAKVNIIRQGFDARKFDAVKTWETELPLLAGKQQKRKEEAQKKLEVERQAADLKKIAAASDLLPTLNEYKSKTETSASGLQYHFITKGNGTKPNLGQTVRVYYEGYFTDGTLLDSNRKEVEESFGMYNPQKDDRGLYEPMTTQIGPDVALFAGFKEAMANMQVGDKVFTYIPSHLAYGETGQGQIKPNTDLIFIIEMVEVVQ